MAESTKDNNRKAKKKQVDWLKVSNKQEDFVNDSDSVKHQLNNPAHPLNKLLWVGKLMLITSFSKLPFDLSCFDSC